MDNLFSKTDTDDCTFCLGIKGGARGNENVYAGVTACDYCSTILDRILDEAVPDDCVALREELKNIRKITWAYASGPNEEISTSSLVARMDEKIVELVQVFRRLVEVLDTSNEGLNTKLRVSYPCPDDLIDCVTELIEKQKMRER